MSGVWSATSPQTDCLGVQEHRCGRSEFRAVQQQGEIVNGTGRRTPRTTGVVSSGLCSQAAGWNGSRETLLCQVLRSGLQVADALLGAGRRANTGEEGLMLKIRDDPYLLRQSPREQQRSRCVVQAGRMHLERACKKTLGAQVCLGLLRC